MIFRDFDGNLPSPSRSFSNLKEEDLGHKVVQEIRVQEICGAEDLRRPELSRLLEWPSSPPLGGGR